MTQLTRSSILTVLSTLSAQFLLANYSYTSDEASYRQNQLRNNQGIYNYQPPSETNAERSFMLESRARLDQIQQDNLNMIEEDRKMINEGYDPNEIDYSNRVNPSKEQYDPNDPYRNQEQMLRGELRG